MQQSSFKNSGYIALGLRKKKIQNSKTTLDCFYPIILPIENSKLLQEKEFSCYSATSSQIKEIINEVISLKPLVGLQKTKNLFLEKINLASQSSNPLENGPATNAQNPLHNYYTNHYFIAVLPSITNPITCTEEAFLKLHLLSTLLIKPHGANLENIFSNLQTICWTNYGPVLASDMHEINSNAKLNGINISVTHTDKFPYLTNYVTPREVRIASSSCARLGAYLSPGTTIMPAGFVNFNAGTLGHAMVEGRISAGVVIGNNTDIGGGASIMGTLSGGGKEVISIGEKCLLGANAGTGISLGFGCTIAAGTYVTASSKISYYNAKNNPINLNGEACTEGENVFYARDFSGKEKMLFLGNSLTGKLIAKPNHHTISLNATLHSN